MVVEDSLLAVGDDGVSIKAGKDSPGRAFAMPSRNVLVRNVTSPRGSRGGVAIGSEMSGGVANVTVRDSTFAGSRGLKIKTCPGRGGYVRDVRFVDVSVTAGIAIATSYIGEVRGGALALLENISFERVAGRGGCRFSCAQAASGECRGLRLVGLQQLRGCSKARAAARRRWLNQAANSRGRVSYAAAAPIPLRASPLSPPHREARPSSE